jgi:hypothetical protein
MGVPTSEVGYTIATTRRETTKDHKNMWWYWEGGGIQSNSHVPKDFGFAFVNRTVKGREKHS